MRQLCEQCTVDTIVTGLKVDLLDLAQPGSAPVALPGTDFASGVSAGGSSDEVYFTLVGRHARLSASALDRRDASWRTTSAPPAIARDVHVAGGRLTAVVGGRVIFSVDPSLGPVQWDSGGVIHVVDLASDEDVVLRSRAAPLPAPGALARRRSRRGRGLRLIITNPAHPDTAVSPQERPLPLHHTMTMPRRAGFLALAALRRDGDREQAGRSDRGRHRRAACGSPAPIARSAARRCWWTSGSGR